MSACLRYPGSALCPRCGYTACHLDRKAKPAMIEVPLEAFALLFAYCHTGQLAVPASARSHPDWPEKRDGRHGHLTAQLRPYAEAAFALLSSEAPRPQSEAKPSAGNPATDHPITPTEGEAS